MIKYQSLDNNESIDKKYSFIVNYLSNILCRDIAVTIINYLYYCKGTQEIIKNYKNSIDILVLVNPKSASPSEDRDILIGQNEINKNIMFLSCLRNSNIKNTHYMDGNYGFINVLASHRSKLFILDLKKITIVETDCDPIHIFTHHTKKINCLTVTVASPSGWIVTGSDDKTIQVYDAVNSNGAVCATFAEHTDSINCVASLADGRIVSGSDDTTIKIWSFESKLCPITVTKSLMTLKGHTDRIRCFQILLDDRIVSGSSDSTIKIWDSITGECLITMRGHDSAVTTLGILPDGRIVSGSCDNTIKIWDPCTGSCDMTLKGHMHWINTIVVLPDSGHIYSGSIDGTVRRWT